MNQSRLPARACRTVSFAVALATATIAMPLRSGATAPASAALSDQIQAILDDAIAPGTINWDCCGADVPPTGASVAVRIPGHADILLSTGSNLDGSPFDAHDPFNTGMTESFVQTVGYQLVDEGVLDPATTIDRWRPDFPNAARVTVDDVLNGTHGLGSLDDAGPVLNADLERRWTLDDQLDLLADLPPSGEPGTFGSDGDTGIKLLAYIVEQETGSTLAELVAERVTTPLGLEGTVMPQDGDEPAGYQQGGFVFADESAVDTSMFPHIAFNTWSLTVDSTVTDVADLVDAWATGALFTTDRSATPGHFLASRPDDGAAAGAFGHPAVIGDHIPINGFCPCTLDGDLVSVTAVGRAPNTVGGDTVAWRFVADDVTIVLRVNSSEATDRSQIRAVVDAIHNAVAAA